MTHRNAESRLPPRRTASTETDRKSVRSFWRGWIFGIATVGMVDGIRPILSQVLP